MSPLFFFLHFDPMISCSKQFNPTNSNNRIWPQNCWFFGRVPSYLRHCRQLLLSLVIWWSPSRERVCSEAVCPRPPLFVSLSLLMPETSADFAFRFWWTSPIQRTSAHASMHHSFCCANYKNSKFKDFKQSRKLSIMLICPLVRKKERKKTCDCNHSCHDLTRICAVITQHCEGSWKSDDRQTLSALFLPVCLLLMCEILQILHSPFNGNSQSCWWPISDGCTTVCAQRMMRDLNNHGRLYSFLPLGRKKSAIATILVIYLTRIFDHTSAEKDRKIWSSSNQGALSVVCLLVGETLRFCNHLSWGVISIQLIKKSAIAKIRKKDLWS